MTDVDVNTEEITIMSGLRSNEIQDEDEVGADAAETEVDDHSAQKTDADTDTRAADSCDSDSATSKSAEPPLPDEGKIKADMQATQTIFDQIETQAKGCSGLIQDWIKKIKSGDVSTEKGLTFLEMKNHSLLNYIISLTGLILNKCSGKSIQGSSYLDQLIESRIILEKIRPIDQKLKYQIDKLVRIAVEGKVDTNDPLMYKANLDNLTLGGQEDDEEMEGDEGKDGEEASTSKVAAKSDGVYRPPKVAPQHYDEDLPKGKTPGESRKRPAINRTLIRELQEEYLETPVEVHNMGDAYAKQLSRQNRDKQRFEETYMTRLPVTKQDKHKQRSMSTLGALGDELTDFTGKRDRANAEGPSKTKKRKMAAKKAKGRGSKKRFRK